MVILDALPEAAEAEQLLIGEVKIANATKGYSYVNCPGSGYDKDVFIGSKTVDISLLAVGDTLAFSVFINHKGLPEAMMPVWRLQSNSKDDSRGGAKPELADYVGKVKPPQQSGNTFVECEAVHNQCGREAFLHVSSLNFLALQAGDTIAFNLHINAQGNPQVSNPCWKALLEEWNSSGAGHAGWSAPVDMHVAPQRALAPEFVSSDLYIGWAKKVDTARSFSMIECPDSGYSRDVYVQSSALDPLGNVAVGDTLAFAIGISDWGKPQAIAPLWKLYGQQDDSRPTKVGDHFGYIARAGPGGAGFVECSSVVEDHGKDAYIHGSVMEACGLEVGDEIMFDVRLNDRGFPQVQRPCWKSCSQEVFSSLPQQVSNRGDGTKSEPDNSKEAGKLAPASQRHPTGYIVGWVSAVDEVKDCAFINAPDSGFEKHVYAHPNVVDLQLLEVGDCVAFRLHVSPKGNPQASGPLWKMYGTPHGNKEPKFGDHVGKVKELKPESVGTHVECPDIQLQYGKEPFLHNSVVEQCSLVAGEIIAFTLHVNSKGLPQVSTACWKSCSSERYLPALGAVDGNEAQGHPSVSVRPVRGVKRKWEESPDAVLQYNASASSSKGPSYVGTVSKIDQARGFSYINMPDSGFDRDVWVHKGAVDPSLLQIGDTVSCEIHVNDRGMPQAKAPVWKLLGRMPSSVNQLEMGKHIGKVKQVVATGAAYVQCPAVREQHGRDAYIGAKLVAEMGISTGDILSFNLNMRDDGFPQIPLPCWVCLSGERWLLSDTGESPTKAPRPPDHPPEPRSLEPRPPDHPPEAEDEVKELAASSDLFEPGGVFKFLDPFGEEEQQIPPTDAIGGLTP